MVKAVWQAASATIAHGREAYLRVGIVGVGLIGGSIGLGLRSAMFADAVVGCDRPEVLDAGARMGCTTDSAPALTDLFGCDLLFLCSPPGACMEALAELGAFPGVVTDVASVKAPVLGAVPEPLAPRFVGGHPIAGLERSGVANARADLFHGAKWAVCPTAQTTPQARDLVLCAVRALRALPVEVEPAEHDRAMALHSHLPHVLATLLLSQSPGSHLAGPSWRDATRVGGANPDLWADILLANRHEVAGSAQRFAAALDGLRGALVDGDREALRAAFAAAQAAKERLWS
jgi:prephenate dehydrogenase